VPGGAGATGGRAAPHAPVMLDEVLAALAPRPDGFYVDATFGRGGHARAILARLGERGALLAIDRDPEAVTAARAMLADEPRATVLHTPFSRLGEAIDAAGRLADGILLDLGVSSPQLDDAARGFSFLRDGPLDMRMDPAAGPSAAAWLSCAKDGEIVQVLQEYGEERYARRIARAIVAARGATPIVTTRQLAEIVAAAHPAWEPGRHPATRSFQAIRIHVNGELAALGQALGQALAVLAAGGRLAVISFHSLEDRIVKRFIRDHARGEQFPRGVPVPQAQLRPPLRAVGRALQPGAAELEQNPRARSAVLRVAERLA